jgi:hypothetical protein
MMGKVKIAQRFLEAVTAGDFDTAAVLLAADAEVVTPDGAETGAEFLASAHESPGLDNLDISIRDRAITEEGGVVVSRARRIFTWKESGEVAYEQPSEAHLTVDAGQVVKFEIRH